MERWGQGRGGGAYRVEQFRNLHYRGRKKNEKQKTAQYIYYLNPMAVYAVANGLFLIS